MSSSPPLVFLGPSLPVAEASALCPGADLRPPATQGDLIGAVLDGGVTVIGLVDGVFDQSPAVWHKEILFALDAGVAVLGAASMGALRAAELGEFGMIGVGEVHAAFARGELTDDDEVALTYSEIDGRYLPSSVPMVNLRGTLQAAVLAGAASDRLAAKATKLAKGQFYADRAYPRLCELLLADGAVAEEVNVLSAFLAARAVDVKADDARKLLRIIARDELTPPPAPGAHRTVALDTLLRRERPLGRRPAVTSVDDLTDRFLAAADDAERMRLHAAERGALLLLGEHVGVRAASGEVDRLLETWRAQHQLENGARLADWLARNRMGLVELRALAGDEVVLGKLRDWAAGARATTGIAPLVLDLLRWTDRVTAELMDAEGPS